MPDAGNKPQDDKAPKKGGFGDFARKFRDRSSVNGASATPVNAEGNEQPLASPSSPDGDTSVPGTKTTP